MGIAMAIGTGIQVCHLRGARSLAASKATPMQNQRPLRVRQYFGRLLRPAVAAKHFEIFEILLKDRILTQQC